MTVAVTVLPVVAPATLVIKSESKIAKKVITGSMKLIDEAKPIKTNTASENFNRFVKCILGISLTFLLTKNELYANNNNIIGINGA